MNAFADRAAVLREKFDEPLPESWIPENPGDELVGTFVRLDKGSTAFGPAWIVVVETDAGDFRSVWLINQALVNEFSRVRPQPGELIGVRYGGKKPVKNPTPGKSATYHDWKVVVDREQVDSAPQWDKVGGDVTVEDDVFESAPVYDDNDVPF